MSENNQLSYSRLRLYQECGQKYKYHYVEKLREKNKSGALFFGSAVDKAFESHLKGSKLDPYAVFDSAFETGDINGTLFKLPDCTRVVYASSDMDWDVLHEEDTAFLRAKAKELGLEDGSAKATYEDCQAAKKQKAHKHYPVNKQKFYNLCNWMSLRRKGHLMVKAYLEHIAPKLTKVVGSQVKIELGNDAGDNLIGFVDCIAHWEGSEQPIVFDFKTSSMEYEEDSVKTSPQLTLYAHALNIKRAGYIVFRKQLKKNRTKVCSVCSHDGSGGMHKTCPAENNKKRCGGAWIESVKPEVEIQVIIDDIPEQTEALVLNNVEAINKAISAGIFIRNFNSCVMPWGRCPYYSMCYKGKVDSEELEQVS